MKELLINNLDRITILAFAIFTGYVIFIGKLKAISYSDYTLKHPYKWLFEAVMLFSGFAIYINGFPWNDWRIHTGGILIGLIGFFALLAGFGLFGESRKNKLYNIIHSTCAIGGFAFTLLGVFIHNWQWGLITSFATIFTYYNSRKYDKEILVFNVEIALSYGIFLSLMFM